MNTLVVGKILTTHALKGEVKVENYSDFNRFQKGAILYIKEQNNYHPLIIHQVRPFKNHLLISFKDHLDINLIEKYRHYLLYIQKPTEEILEDEEYHYHQLIGLKAYNQHHKYLGQVTEIRQVPQGELLAIKTATKTALVPFIKQFVQEITKDTIIINEIEGLF